MFATFIHALFIASILTALSICCLYILSLRVQDAGVIDPAWAALIALCGLGYAVTLNGYAPRQLLIAFMYCLWGLRLAFYLLPRVLKHTGEEPRYLELRIKWGKEANRKMFFFYLFQGAVALGFSLPALIVSLNHEPRLFFLEWIGCMLWLAAFIGELTSDLQLELFKSNPENKGKTCRLGLWNYSRHPNYFFEWLIWVAIAVFSLSSPYGFAALLCPAFMYHFLVNVTGIPGTEEQALKSRGDEYRAYQRSTNKFFPWMPKKI